MAEWTQSQRRAIESLDRPFALIAGAGSGKTTVLVERYRRLLSRGLRPHQILTVTFTKEAAAQLKERIVRRLESEEQDHSAVIREVESTSAIGTIHAFCYGVLDQFGGLIGLARVEGVVDPFMAALAFDREYDRWVEGLPQDEWQDLLSRHGRADIRRIARDLWGAHREAATVLSDAAETVKRSCLPLWNRLDESLLAKGLYTFSDLETLTARLLQSSPEVIEKLAERFKAVLIDEFQDTSPLQWKLLRTAVKGDLKRVFVVGDPKQSIYGFRHADVRVFLATAREFAEAGGEVGELSENFRSRPDLLASINDLSGPLFEGSDVPFSEMVPGRQDEAQGPCRSVLHFEETAAEPAAVAAKVRELVDRGESPEDIALLFRVSDRIPKYRAALSEAGLPSQLRQSQAMFESYDVLDLANALEALADPLDDFALVSFLRSSYVNLSRADLARLQAVPEKTFFAKLVAQGGPWAELMGSLPTTVGEALSAIFRVSGRMPERSEAAMGFVAALLPESTPLFEAVERIRRWKREDLRVVAGSDARGVRLMTVHGAKGLEFKHVFLVDALRSSPRSSPPLLIGAEGIFGLRWKENGEPVQDETYTILSEAAKERELEESKRILYVALTRARETLTLSLPAPGVKIPKDTWGDWLGASR